MIGLQFLALVFSAEMWRRIHWSVGLALFILLGSGIHTFFFPGNYPIVQDPFIITRGAGEILYSVVSLLFFSSLILFKSDKFFKQILRLLFFCALLDSAVLIFNFLFLKQRPPYAMLNNGTADAAFIVCLLPMAFEKRIWLLPMIIALILSKSNTAIAGIGIALAFYLLPKLKFKTWLKIMIPSLLGIILLAYLVLDKHFMGDSGRGVVWQGSWRFYLQFANPWIGFGTGTFTVWGIAWQKAAHLNDPKFPLWAWLHNEFLEILFENGIIGLVSSLAVFYFILKRTYKKSIAFPIACVYGLTAMTEMPLRLFVTQILGVCLLSEAFKKDCESIPKL